MNYAINCITCNAEIKYKNYDSFRNSSKTLCKKCTIELRDKNNKLKRAKLADETGFVFNPRKDLTGKTINCWKIISFSGRRLTNKTKFYFWDTECTNCGIVVSKETSHINKTKTCRHCRLMPKGQSGLNSLFGRYKRTARTLTREFNLTIEQFAKLTNSNCYYCNAIPSKIVTNNAYLDNKISHWGDYFYNGIDRMNNGVGYIDGNCIPCCDICNWAKSDREFGEFKEYILGICKNAIAGTIPFLLTEGQPGVKDD
jgi:hypothetical protein